MSPCVSKRLFGNSTCLENNEVLQSSFNLEIHFSSDQKLRHVFPTGDNSLRSYTFRPHQQLGNEYLEKCQLTTALPVMR